MQNKKFKSIVAMLLSVMVIFGTFVVPSLALTEADYNKLDPALFEKEVTAISDKVSETNGISGTFKADDGSTYTLLAKGNVVTIKGLAVPDGTESFSIPTKMELYVWDEQDPPEDAEPNAEPIKYRRYLGTFTVTSISTALSGVTNLIKELYIPKNVVTIESSAFADNTSIERVYMPNVTKINAKAFMNCRNLEGVYAPIVQFLDTSAFAYCSSLKSFDFTTVYNIGDSAFYYCNSLKEVSLPKALQYLGKSAFEKCNSIETLNIPEDISINRIPANAFADCTALKEISFPYEIVTLDASSFTHCDSLKYINLLDSNIASIGDKAFYGCLNVEYILLPATLKTFAATAFESCTSLRHVYFGCDLTATQEKNVASSDFASCVIRKTDTKGPKGVISSDNKPFDEKIIYKPTDVTIMSDVDIKNVSVVYDDTDVPTQSVMSTVYGYSTKAYSFTANEIGVYTITAEDMLGNTKTITVEHSDSVNLDEFNVKLDKTVFEYTGSEIKPEVTLGNLVEGEDYTVSYKDNKEIGTATVVITGMNDFYGSIERTFEIVPNVPSNFGVKTAAKTSLSLQWSKDPQVTGYELYKYNETTGDYDMLYKGSSITYTLSSLAVNTIYKFQLRSYKTNTDKIYYSDFVNIDAATTATAVTNVVATSDSTSSVSLVWTATDNATGYEIERYTGATYQLVATTSENSYIDSGLTANTSYKYRVRSFRTVDDKKYYSEYSSIATAPTIANIVEGFTASSVKTNSIVLTWDRVSDATGYEIEKFDNDQGRYVLLLSTSKNTITDSNLTSATTYEYRIRSYRTINKINYYTDYTPALIVNTLPDAPKNTEATPLTTSSLSFSWEPTSNATGYEVERYNNDTRVYENIATVITNSYTDNQLEAGKNYIYRVRAFRTAYGETQYSDYTADVQATTYPNTPVATVAAYTDNVKVKWDAVNGATSYIVYKYDNSIKEFKEVGKTTELFYTFTKLDPAEFYTFKVVAEKLFNKVSYKSEAAVVSTNTILPDVVSVSATPGTTTVTLTWPAVTRATGYMVYVYDAVTDTYKIVGETAEVSYTAKGLKEGTTYKFAVAAFSTSNPDTIWSQGKTYVSVKTKYSYKTLFPDYEKAPTVSVCNTTNGVKISWNKLSGATHYRVYYRTSNGWQTITTLGSDATSYIDANIKSGTSRTYTVKGIYSKNGTTINSKYNATGTTIKYLTCVKLSGATNDAKGIKLTWNRVPEATGYIVYRKTTGGWTKLAVIKSNSTVTYTDEKASNNLTYTYAVKAYSGNYGSAYVSKTVTRLVNPTIKSVTNGTSGITIKWNQVGGATGYYVYRKTGSGDWVKLMKVESGKTVSYTDKSVKSGTTYTYAVRAFNSKGTSSYYTKTIKFLSTPKLSKVTTTTGKVTITFSKVSGAKSYNVYRKTTNGTWEKIGATTTSTYVDKTAKKGTTYYYTVRAVSGSYVSYYDKTGLKIKAK